MKPLLFALLFFSCFNTMAQDSLGTDQESKNNIYLELLGSGIYYSFNYDRVIYTRSIWILRTRVGAELFPSASYSLIFPFGISETIGEKHCFEMEVSSAYVFDGSDGLTYSKVIGGSVGYRYQPRNKGFMFRATLIPVYYDLVYKEWFTVFRDGFQIFGNAGASIGYSF